MTDRPDMHDAQPADGDVDPEKAFAQFVVTYAPTMVGIARLITGDRATAALAVDEAWPEVYRRWRRIARMPSPVASALAPFVSASVRSAERNLPAARRGLELREGGLVDAGTVLGHDRPESSIGEALLDLSPRARAVLSLRWYAGLADPDLVRATGPHPLRPARVADAALADLLQTVAPAVEARTAAGATGLTRQEELTTRFRAELAERAGPAVDGQAELVRIRPALTDVRQLHPRRPVPRRAVAAVGGLVAAMVVTGLAVTSGGGGGATGERTRPPVAVGGGQLVGFQSVYVTVPGSWSHNGLRCGRVVESTVVYPDAPGGCDDRPLPVLAVPASSVTFSVPPTSPIPLGRLTQVSSVGGYQVFGTTPFRRNGVLQQVVVIPQANVQMMVRTPDPRVLDDIVDSLEAVPQGYVVVPVCTRLPLREAIGRLVAAGLNVKLTQASTVSMHFGAPPVSHQSIATGRLVARGTVVGLGFPSTN
ncbi:MAG: hypothetical protein WBV37_07845 [Nocardioidaceae bacterium]